MSVNVTASKQAGCVHVHRSDGRGGGHAAARRRVRLERHPAQAAQVVLGAGVGVVTTAWSVGPGHWA